MRLGPTRSRLSRGRESGIAYNVPLRTRLNFSCVFGENSEAAPSIATAHRGSASPSATSWSPAIVSGRLHGPSRSSAIACGRLHSPSRSPAVARRRRDGRSRSLAIVSKRRDGPNRRPAVTRKRRHGPCWTPAVVRRRHYGPRRSPAIVRPRRDGPSRSPAVVRKRRDGPSSSPPVVRLNPAPISGTLYRTCASPFGPSLPLHRRAEQDPIYAATARPANAPARLDSGLSSK
jgi:hypothetical protein